MRKAHKRPKRRADREARPPDAIEGVQEPDKSQPAVAVGRGRSIASISVALGIGISLVAISLSGDRTPKVIVGSRDEVYYSGGATKREAKSLGRALQAARFFLDRGAVALLSKGEGGTVVSFVVNKGAWDLPKAQLSYEEVGRQVAEAVGGFPIKVRLLDKQRTPRRELVVGKVTIGALDEIYYYGSATQADAIALGRALRAAGFFKDQGASVVLNKGEGTAISFVVNANAWERPDAVAGFESLARWAAASIGGLPVQLRLVSADMAAKVEMVVQ